MSPLVVLQKIRQVGGSVMSDAGELRISAPPGLLSDEDRELLERFKPDLVKILPTCQDLERVAIQWESSAPDEELDQALERALVEWERNDPDRAIWAEAIRILRRPETEFEPVVLTR